MDDNFEILEEVANPLDSVEDVLANQEWMYNRLNDDELNVTVSGQGCEYEISFLWDEQTGMLSFTSELDIVIPADRIDTAAYTIMVINNKLDIGHFSMSENFRNPVFRHNSLYRGCVHISATEHTQELLGMALETCERYYNIFEILAAPMPVNDATLSLALMETNGRA